MRFENAFFIKPDVTFVKSDIERTIAPMFRKKFSYSGEIREAKLSVCGLGYGYYWINGKKVTEDLFTAPVSNYTKTLWYNTYDVTQLICRGENVLAVICGNGWYNEVLSTPWKFNGAEWRDIPKFVLKLTINGEDVLVSDDGWKCKPNSAIIYNQLRSGEHFDSRLFDENWTEYSFDDSTWEYAVKDVNPPKGIFRECLCEPIHECELYPARNIIKKDEDTQIFDIGQNISGYIRLRVKGSSGNEIKIRYAEELNDDGSLRFNGMESFYPKSVFQEDRFICNGKEFTWSPIFAYHGFRYIQLSGLKKTDFVSVSGVFVHQDVRIRSGFKCSDFFLNRLFYIGQMSTLSNLFYAPTDCPTREKMGWANDAQASAEQMLINFETEGLFHKWMVDIHDAVREDGALPGIIPTCGWGYQWGNGPVSDGVLFELPYQIYLQTGNSDMLRDSLPYFRKYFKYLDSKTDEDGFISFGLDDWTAPIKERKVYAPFVNALLKVKFLRIAIMSAWLSNHDESDFVKMLEQERSHIIGKFIDERGICRINEQTAVAMLIYYGVYNEFAPLREQLKKLVEDNNYHHCCGMVGLRHLYNALNMCGLEEYAYRIITAEGFPSYRDWIDNGATTLGEYWDMSVSKNHHMYSAYMAWMIQTVIGIRMPEGTAGYEKVEIAPYFFHGLDYAEGFCCTVKGKISAAWRREKSNIILNVDIPESVDAYYKGRRLKKGKNEFVIAEE